MSSRDTHPAWIAVSIIAALTVIIALYRIDAALFDIRDLAIRDAMSQEQYYDAFYKYRAEYSMWTLAENRRHFDWNLRSTKYIFWVSMFVSLSGVVFAFWQFAQANQFDRAQRDHDEVSFRTRMAELSFKSRSVASLILFVSIVYLLIYVAFLYPIRHAPNALEGGERPDGPVPVDDPLDAAGVADGTPRPDGAGVGASPVAVGFPDGQ